MSHTCGRRYDTENFLRAMRKEPAALADHDAGPDEWQDRGGHRACSYCGSAHPDDVMAGVAAGTVELGPTDKGYKMYLQWNAGTVGGHKFYTTHLRPEQSEELRTLIMSKQVRIGYPGHFYAGIYLPGLKERT